MHLGLGLPLGGFALIPAPPDIELAGEPYSGSNSGTWLVATTSVTRNGSAAGQASVFLDRNPTNGANYRVRFTVADKTGDDFFYRLGGGGTAHQITGNMAYDQIVASGGTTPQITFAPWGGAAGQATITGISVQAA